MNFPIGRKERLDILLREKVRSAMRAVKDANFPAIFVGWRVLELSESSGELRLCQLQDVTGAKNPSSVAAELPKCERRLTAQIVAECQIRRPPQDRRGSLRA